MDHHLVKSRQIDTIWFKCATEIFWYYQERKKIKVKTTLKTLLGSNFLRSQTVLFKLVLPPPAQLAFHFLIAKRVVLHFLEGPVERHIPADRKRKPTDQRESNPWPLCLALTFKNVRSGFSKSHFQARQVTSTVLRARGCCTRTSRRERDEPRCRAGSWSRWSERRPAKIEKEQVMEGPCNYSGYFCPKSMPWTTSPSATVRWQKSKDAHSLGMVFPRTSASGRN